MTTAFDGAVDRLGDLELSRAVFKDRDSIPDWVRYANENDNPPLSIDGVLDDAESLVRLLDDHDADVAVGLSGTAPTRVSTTPGSQSLSRLVRLSVAVVVEPAATVSVSTAGLGS